MYTIVLSLERAKERREKIKSQLKELGVDGMIIDAVDGKTLSEEELNKKIHLPGGYRYGDQFKPGELGCTMSHIKALKIARDKNWPYVVVLEDDIIMAKDYRSRMNLLFKILPQDWEHVYLSATLRHFGLSPMLSFPNLIPSLKNTECTHSMVIKASAFDKVINYLSLFETTTDDSYNNFIHNLNQLKSYTYFPFVTYAYDQYTYIWDHTLDREHPSKKFFRDKLFG